MARSAGPFRLEFATPITHSSTQRLYEAMGWLWTMVAQIFDGVAGTSSSRIDFIHSAAMVSRSSIVMPA